MGSPESGPAYGQSMVWKPERPRWRVFPILATWLSLGVAVFAAAGILPGVAINDFLGALVVAAIVALLNAVIAPALAALRLPATSCSCCSTGCCGSTASAGRCWRRSWSQP